MNQAGILTFHCADNFGAMLQAYALKKYLKNRNIKADIIRYEPPFMTGRYWWIPYIPIGNAMQILYRGWNGWKENLKLGKVFFERRKNMRHFREEYLISTKQRKLSFYSQLRKLPYQYYIVGSDQIWNPDITLGLKKAYFGAFKNNSKKKVIAYAASIGSASLRSEYDTEFSKLIRSVDCISVRENAAIPYISRFCGEDVLMLLDPVFLLEKEEWKALEKQPVKERYIFLYMTERNDKMVDFAKKLSRRKKLQIIEIENKVGVTDKDVLSDYIAGPAEFLGYIHKADYVVTNSFHGTAFSVIFHKKFMAFPHSNVGARTENILDLFGLACRLYREEKEQIIDSDIVWDAVDQCIAENVKYADFFLLRNLKYCVQR